MCLFGSIGYIDGLPGRLGAGVSVCVCVCVGFVHVPVHGCVAVAGALANAIGVNGACVCMRRVNDEANSCMRECYLVTECMCVCVWLHLSFFGPH